MNIEIIKLVEMALSDGILTEKEKEILYRKANKLGIDEDEFELYLQGQLDQLTPKSNENKHKCPNCGALIPVLSKICEFCGYAFQENKSAGISVENLIEKIHNNIVDLKSLPKHNVFKTIFEYSYISVPILTTLLFLLSFKTIDNLAIPFFFLSIILGIISIILIRNRIKKRPEKNKNILNFETIKANFEKHSKLSKAYYGNDIKVSKLIQDFEKEVKDIEIERKNNKKTAIITYGIIFLVVILTFVFIPKHKNYTEIQKDELQIFTEQMKDLTDFKLNIQPQQINVSGDLSKYIKITEAEYQLTYYISTGYFDKPYISCKISNVKFIVIKKYPEPSTNPEYMTLKLTLDVVDENGMAIPDLPTLESINEEKLKDAIISGSGEIFIDFEGEQYEKTSDKDRINGQIIQLKSKGKLFIINSTFKR